MSCAPGHRNQHWSLIICSGWLSDGDSGFGLSTEGPLREQGRLLTFIPTLNCALALDHSPLS